MNITVITGRGFETFGGIETYVKEIYTRLAMNGHEVAVYSREFLSNVVDGLSKQSILSSSKNIFNDI